MERNATTIKFCSNYYCSLFFICNVVFGITAIVFNLSIIIALRRIARRKPWKVSNIILCGMAIIDLLTGLICQPLHGYFVLASIVHWHSKMDSWLFFVLVYSSYSLCCASLLIISLMAIERYIAVVFIFKYRTSFVSQPSSIVKIIVSIIIFSFVIPWLRFMSKSTAVVFTILVILIVTVSTITVIVLNCSLFYSLKKRGENVRFLSSDDEMRVRLLCQERHVAKSFALLAAVILVMYLPQILLKPISILVGLNGSSASQLLLVLEDFSNTLLYSNSAVNPIVYFIRHKAVRAQIKSFCFASEKVLPRKQENNRRTTQASMRYQETKL